MRSTTQPDWFGDSAGGDAADEFVPEDAVDPDEPDTFPEDDAPPVLDVREANPADVADQLEPVAVDDDDYDRDGE